jgi:hypothetical protein
MPNASFEPAAFPMPAAPAFVSSKTEPTALPAPAQPLFVSPKTEPVAFPAPAQPLFVSPKTEPVAFPAPAQPLFVSPRPEAGTSPSPPAQTPSAGPPYFSSAPFGQTSAPPNAEYQPSPYQSANATHASHYGAAPYGATPLSHATEPIQPARDYAKPQAAAAPSGTSPVQAFSASGYFVTNATGAWQAQQPAAADARQAPAAPTVLPLSFEQLTCLTAEIESNPGKAATALAGYGIDNQAYQAQIQSMRVRCEADPELQQRYDRLIQYYRAVVTQR